MVIALLLFAAMGLCPPWVYTGFGTSVVRPAGYHLVFAPPTPESDRWADGVRIDGTRLLLQWAVLAAVVGALMIRRSKPYIGTDEELLLNKRVDDDHERPR